MAEKLDNSKTQQPDFLVSLTRDRRTKSFGIALHDCHDGKVRIKETLADSPAAECGRVRAGDILLEVNGKSTVGQTKVDITNGMIDYEDNTIQFRLRSERSVVGPSMLMQQCFSAITIDEKLKFYQELEPLIRQQDAVAISTLFSIDKLYPHLTTLLPEASFYPLHMVCAADNTEILGLLLQYGMIEHINQTNDVGLSPIFVATAAGNLHTVEYLLDHGARDTERVLDENSAIRAALLDNRHVIVKILASETEPEALTDVDLIYLAIKLGNYVIIKSFYSELCDMDCAVSLPESEADNFSLVVAIFRSLDTARKDGDIEKYAVISTEMHDLFAAGLKITVSDIDYCHDSILSYLKSLNQIHPDWLATSGLERLLYYSCSQGVESILKRYWLDGLDVNITHSLADGKCGYYLSAVFLAYMTQKKGEKTLKRSFRHIIKFLLEKGGVISQDIADQCPKAILNVHLQRKEVSSEVETTKKRNFDTISWTNKNLKGFSYSTWLLPYVRHIVELDLSGNLFETLPQEIFWELVSIERFTLCDCPSLREFPAPKCPESTCRKLNTIKIMNNKKLKKIPLDIFNLKQLRHCEMTGNAIDFDEHQLNDTQFEKWKATPLEELNFNIPCGISNCTNLRRLDIAHNQLKRLPEPWICPLNVLNCSFNQLEELPTKMNQVWKQYLEKIEARHNCLKSIPVGLVALRRLIYLDLSENSIDTLPKPEHWHCKRLQCLNVASNNIYFKAFNPKSKGRQGFVPGEKVGQNVFPTVFKNSVTSIRLSHNRLTAVPLEICLLNCLEELDLGHNPIIDIPKDLGGLELLKLLFVEGLSLEGFPDQLNPRKSKVKSTDLISFLRARLKNSSPFDCKKLIFVGNDHGTKTALIQSIGQDQLSKNSFGSSISTFTWKFIPQNDKKLKWKSYLRPSLHFNVWELHGGDASSLQDQLFMTDNSVYVVVFRINETEVESLGNWLFHIHNRAPNSPVILIGTNLDEYQLANPDWIQKLAKLRQSIINLPERLFKTSKSLQLFYVSRISSVGFTEDIRKIRNAIVESTISELNKNKIPQNYFDLRDLIEKIKNEPGCLWISKNDLICRASEENLRISRDEAEFVKCLQVLNDCGFLQYFGEFSSSMESSYLYFSPTWLSDKITKLLNYQVGKRKRKLTIAEVNRLLTDTHCPEALVNNITEILQIFELLVKLSPNTMLLPAYLPATAPEFDYDFDGFTICRVYVMNTTPAGFWTRLIVRLLNVLKKSTENKKPSTNDSQHQEETGGMSSGASRLIARSQSNEGLLMSESESGSLPFRPGSMSSRRHPVDRQQSFSVKSLATRLKRHKTLREVQAIKEASKIVYWAEGMLFLAADYFMKVESVSQSQLMNQMNATADTKGVVVTVQSLISSKALTPNGVLTFTTVIDIIDQLIATFFHDYDYGEQRIMSYVLCPLCLQSLHSDGSNCTVGCVQLEHMAAYITKDDVYLCPVQAHQPVSIQSVVPDLKLTDLPVSDHLDIHEVDIGASVFQGGQALVRRGTVRGVDAAIKVYYDPSVYESHDIQNAAVYEGEFTTIMLTRNSLINSHGEAGRNLSEISAFELSPMLSQLQTMRREVKIISQMSHPCIVKLIGVVVKPAFPICFALEFAPFGDLKEYLRGLRRSKVNYATTGSKGIFYGSLLDKPLLFSISTQIISAINYLHKECIIYRDLKCDNVLLWSTDSHCFPNIKLSDYGISASVDDQGTKGCEGTPGFQAPEVLQGLIYDQKVDIFSYAMVLFEILTGVSPFSDLQFAEDIQRRVKAGRRPTLKDEKIKSNTNGLEKLMKACWSSEALNRPHAQEIVEYLCLWHQILFCRAVEIGDNVAHKLNYSIVNSPRSESTESRVVDSNPSRKIDALYPATVENTTFFWFWSFDEAGWMHFNGISPDDPSSTFATMPIYYNSTEMSTYMFTAVSDRYVAVLFSVEGMLRFDLFTFINDREFFPLTSNQIALEVDAINRSVATLAEMDNMIYLIIANNEYVYLSSLKLDHSGESNAVIESHSTDRINIPQHLKCVSKLKMIPASAKAIVVSANKFILFDCTTKSFLLESVTEVFRNGVEISDFCISNSFDAYEIWFSTECSLNSLVYCSMSDEASEPRRLQDFQIEQNECPGSTSSPTDTARKLSQFAVNGNFDVGPSGGITNIFMVRDTLWVVTVLFEVVVVPADVVLREKIQILARWNLPSGIKEVVGVGVTGPGVLLLVDFGPDDIGDEAEYPIGRHLRSFSKKVSSGSMIDQNGSVQKVLAWEAFGVAEYEHFEEMRRKMLRLNC